MKTTNSELDNRTITIDSKRFGGDYPTLIAAEIGQTHEGSLGAAFAFVDSISASGAQAVKFQIHFASEESSIDDVFRVHFSRQDKTRFDYWKRMEFTEEQWAGLIAYAKEKQLIVICSIFSEKAFELIKNLPVDGIKIASGEVSNEPLIQWAVDSRKPVFLSSGMSTLAECDKLVESVAARTSELVIFQCTSEYPTPLYRVGLNVLDEFSARYPIPIGLSDHSGTVYPGFYGISTSIAVLELHVTFSKELFGPDISSSVSFEDLRILTKFNSAMGEMKSHPVDKDEVANDLSNMRSLFTRSVGVRESLSAGTVITRDMLIGRKPGTGVPFEQRDSFVGRRLKSDVSLMRLLSFDDLES